MRSHLRIKIKDKKKYFILKNMSCNNVDILYIDNNIIVYYYYVDLEIFELNENSRIILRYFPKNLGQHYDNSAQNFWENVHSGNRLSRNLTVSVNRHGHGSRCRFLQISFLYAMQSQFLFRRIKQQS
jgi:hypothetical protein